MKFIATRNTIRGIVHIQRPPSEVFAFIADYRHDSLWRREVHSVKYTTPEPNAAANNQFVEIVKVLGRQCETWQEIVRYEANASIVCATFKASVPYVSERTVKQSEGGTELDIQIHYDPGPRWRDRILRSIMRRLEQRRLNRALWNLKQLFLEQSKVVYKAGE